MADIKKKKLENCNQGLFGGKMVTMASLFDLFPEAQDEPRSVSKRRTVREALLSIDGSYVSCTFPTE